MPETSKVSAPTARRLTTKPSIPYVDLFRTSAVDRIAMIKAGVSAVEAKKIMVELQVAQGLSYSMLKLSVATVNRKAARNETLPPGESERVIGVARLRGQLEAMIEESGRPAGFDAAAWMSQWLQEPLPALGGRRPLDLLDTMEGQSLVSHALAQIQSGAYG